MAKRAEAKSQSVEANDKQKITDAVD